MSEGRQRGREERERERGGEGEKEIYNYVSKHYIHAHEIHNYVSKLSKNTKSFNTTSVNTLCLATLECFLSLSLTCIIIILVHSALYTPHQLHIMYYSKTIMPLLQENVKEVDGL